ncbi:MAG: hypothetical protein ACJAT6_001809 [Akkermansiaceae bacterium]|jgi:hypothetical protein
MSWAEGAVEFWIFFDTLDRCAGAAADREEGED